MRPIYAAYLALLCLCACLITAPAQAQVPPAYAGTTQVFLGTTSTEYDELPDPVGTWLIIGKDANGTSISTNQPDWNVTKPKSAQNLSVTIPTSAPLGNYVAYYLSFVGKPVSRVAAGDHYLTYPTSYCSASFQVVTPPDARPAYGMPAFSWQGTVAGVNTGNGNKTTTLPIVGWTMRGGMPVSCALIHNSHGVNYTTWGNKWTSTYFSYLTNTSGAPVLHWDTGLSYTFQKNPDGSYQPPYGILDKLVNNGGGKFTLTATDNTKYIFTLVSGDSGGYSYLSSIVDEDGNTLTISHNSNTTK